MKLLFFINVFLRLIILRIPPPPMKSSVKAAYTKFYHYCWRKLVFHLVWIISHLNLSNLEMMMKKKKKLKMHCVACKTYFLRGSLRKYKRRIFVRSVGRIGLKSYLDCNLALPDKNWHLLSDKQCFVNKRFGTPRMCIILKVC